MNKNNIKNWDQFVNESNSSDELKPKYYTNYYTSDPTNNQTFISVDINTHEITKYTGSEYKDLFMHWYNKIEPFLDKNDQDGALEILIDWDEETLAKFDLYSLVRKYFKNSI